MPYITTDRLMLVTFTVEMMRAAITGPSHLEKVTNCLVADGYPMDDYRELLPYKIERFSQYPEENEWEGVIIHKEDHVIMGDLGFKGGPDEKGKMDMGYSIIPGYQGNGYATEMAIAAINWGLEQPNVQRITASCSDQNIPSIRVLEKAGLKQLRKEDHEIYWST